MHLDLKCRTNPLGYQPLDHECPARVKVAGVGLERRNDGKVFFQNEKYEEGVAYATRRHCTARFSRDVAF